MKINITEKELLYSLSGVALIIIWFLYIQELIAPWLSALHPFIAFIIYESGLFVGAYLLSSILVGKVTRLKMSSIAVSMYIGADLLVAPLLVMKNGSIIMSDTLWYVSSDAAFGSLFNSIGVSGQIFGYGFVYLLTYIIMPTLFLFIIPIILSDPKKIAKKLGA